MIRELCNGRLVDVDEHGKAELLTCGWLIEVASGNPEPDSIEDTIKIIECGAKLYALGEGWRCSVGHHHHPTARPNSRPRNAARRSCCCRWIAQDISSGFLRQASRIGFLTPSSPSPSSSGLGRQGSQPGNREFKSPRGHSHVIPGKRGDSSVNCHRNAHVHRCCADRRGWASSQQQQA